MKMLVSRNGFYYVVNGDINTPVCDGKRRYHYKVFGNPKGVIPTEGKIVASSYAEAVYAIGDMF
jgi:hypothetical protein